MKPRLQITLWLLIAVIIMISPPFAQSEELLKCAGSRTATYVVEPLAKGYDKADVIVIGGHSGDGFRRLFEGQTDIVMASRKVKEEEKKKAATLGIELVEAQIGYSPIMIAVHPDNPVNSLTMTEVKEIFTGKIVNWDSVGGEAVPIEVFALDDPSSGTVAMFKKQALNRGDFGKDSVRVARLTTALKAVAKRPGAICFCRPGDMQYHQTHSQGAIKILGLKAGRDGQVYTPDKKYGVTGDYPLNRGLFLYYDKNAKDPLIKDFVEYCVAATQ